MRGRCRTTRRKPPVIGDVARVAGVSVPTVSRVLTGAAQVVGREAQRVLAAIDELELPAVAPPRAPWSPAAATHRGPGRQHLAVRLRRDDPGRRGERARRRLHGHDHRRRVRRRRDRRPGGLARARPADRRHRRAQVRPARSRGAAPAPEVDIPTVSISGVREAGVPQAVLDEADAAEELVDYLLDLGHATVHHVRVPPSRKKTAAPRDGAARSSRTARPCPCRSTRPGSRSPAGSIGRELAA